MNEIITITGTSGFVMDTLKSGETTVHEGQPFLFNQVEKNYCDFCGHDKDRMNYLFGRTQIIITMPKFDTDEIWMSSTPILRQILQMHAYECDLPGAVYPTTNPFWDISLIAYTELGRKESNAFMQDHAHLILPFPASQPGTAILEPKCFSN